MSRKITITKIAKRPERELLRDVYSYILRHWAVNNADIERGTKLDLTEVKRLTGKLARAGLLEGTHVNSQRTITWQTFFDVDNDADAIVKGRAEFNRVFPEDAHGNSTVPDDLGTLGNKLAKAEAEGKAKTATHQRNTGARYTEKQLQDGFEAKESGQSWKQVAATVGVKSPFHFSKQVRGRFPELGQ